MQVNQVSEKNQKINALVEEYSNQKVLFLTEAGLVDEKKIVEMLNNLQTMEEKNDAIYALFQNINEKVNHISIEFNKKLIELAETDDSEVLREWRVNMNAKANKIYEAMHDFQCVKEVNEWLKKKRAADEIERLHKVELYHKTFRAIDMCDVYYSGWECDGYAWVIEDDGVKKLVTTNHGSAYIEDKKFLHDKIAEYKEAIKSHERLLRLLDSK